MSMNDEAHTTSRTSGRWAVGYTLIGRTFADGAAELMPVNMFVGASPDAAHAQYAEMVANDKIVHLTLTDPAGIVVASARTDVALPAEAKIGTQLSGYGFNEYDQVTHAAGSVWYVRSLTVRIFPNGESALVAVNVTDHVDHGLCKSFPSDQIAKTGDGAHDREFCPHGHQRNQTTVADTDDITACCAVPVGVTGDGFLHCRCCWAEVTGGHQTELHHIDL